MTRTEECDFVCGTNRMRTVFYVARVPESVYATEDGSVGWQSELFANKIIWIDASRAEVTVLQGLPAETKTWTKCAVRTNECIIGLEVPGRGGKVSVVNLDTGSPAGVMLSPKAWREWKASHPERAKTLNAYYMKGTGLVVAEEAWAKDISFGPLALSNVPVMEANKADVALSGPSYEATLGLAALRRIDLIIDGKLRIAYFRTNQSPLVVYSHNCLGAVFTPENLVTYEGKDLVAHVAPDSPAFQAGIRDGDALLRYNDIDVTVWRTQPTVIPSFGCNSAEGPIQLMLRRGKRVFTVEVMLRPILAPEADGQTSRP
jgi:hypothetical protein